MKTPIFKIGILGKKTEKLKLLYYAMRWHFRYYILRRFSPISCGIYVTNRCNFACGFCNLWRNPQLETISLERLKDIVNFLASSNCFYLSLSGGEPFIVEDIYKMLSFAKSKIPYVHVVSNGFVLTRDAVLQLKSTNIDEISVSIDGLEATHDLLRNKKGAFRQVIGAIENIKNLAPQIEIVVNSIICRQNLEELPGVVNLVASYGLKHKFQPVNVHPVFDGQCSFSEIQTFNNQDLDKLDALIGFLKRQRNVVNSNYFLSLIPEYFRGATQNGISQERCLFGYHHCEFNERGELFPCLTGLDWRDGFKIDKKIEEVMYSKQYKRRLSELESCRLCQKNIYICYFEPRITFPFKNFVKYTIFGGAR